MPRPSRTSLCIVGIVDRTPILSCRCRSRQVWPSIVLVIFPLSLQGVANILLVPPTARNKSHKAEIWWGYKTRLKKIDVRVRHVHHLIIADDLHACQHPSSNPRASVNPLVPPIVRNKSRNQRSGGDTKADAKNRCTSAVRPSSHHHR